MNDGVAETSRRPEGEVAAITCNTTSVSGSEPTDERIARRGNMRDNRILFRLSVPVTVFREDEIYVAGCRALDVYSQGSTREQARNNVQEALIAFVTSCYERGTLERVLLEAGFTPDTHPEATDADDDPDEMIHIPLSLIAHAQAHAA